jgi:regulator of RNase E activity RraA
MTANKKLLEKLQTLFVAVVCDILDQMGYRQQFMNHEIRPLLPNSRIAGYAFTMQAQETSRFPEVPYLKQFEATDRVEEGEVIIASGCGMNTAFFGNYSPHELSCADVLGSLSKGWYRIRINSWRWISPFSPKGFCHPIPMAGWK